MQAFYCRHASLSIVLVVLYNKRMYVHRRGGVSGPIAFFLALLLIVLVVGAGFLWLREADARLQAEQELKELQAKYDELKAECNALKNGGQSGGISLSGSQNPMVASLGTQTELPQCEEPTVQPVTQQMLATDQQFFAGAREGDVLISYPATGVVYLYRPSTETLLSQAQLPDRPAAPSGMSL